MTKRKIIYDDEPPEDKDLYPEEEDEDNWDNTEEKEEPDRYEEKYEHYLYWLFKE